MAIVVSLEQHCAQSVFGCISGDFCFSRGIKEGKHRFSGKCLFELLPFFVVSVSPLKSSVFFSRPLIVTVFADRFGINFPKKFTIPIARSTPFFLSIGAGMSRIACTLERV